MSLSETCWRSLRLVTTYIYFYNFFLSSHYLLLSLMKIKNEHRIFAILLQWTNSTAKCGNAGGLLAYHFQCYLPRIIPLFPLSMPFEFDWQVLNVMVP
jgi:hypothetical protein